MFTSQENVCLIVDHTFLITTGTNFKLGYVALLTTLKWIGNVKSSCKKGTIGEVRFIVV